MESLVDMPTYTHSQVTKITDRFFQVSDIIQHECKIKCDAKLEKL